ncbi:MAG: hypothetical protein ACKVP0_22830 [Pirellulaceae bacterium]
MTPGWRLIQGTNPCGVMTCELQVNQERVDSGLDSETYGKRVFPKLFFCNDFGKSPLTQVFGAKMA